MAVSQRLMVLSQSKQLHSRYVPPRTSPQWPVSPAALNANCSPRLTDLAVSKKFHPLFIAPRPVQTDVPLSARNVKPSPRIILLAHPIPRKRTTKLLEGQKNKFYSAKPSPVSSRTYPRLEKLAVSKSLHPNFVPNQQKQRTITRAALNAIASPRLVELSAPPSRKMIKNTFEPYKVNPSTQHVVASDRILELAKPKKYQL
ncbi:testicular haploid expressed gene protein-like isoform X4 [Octopus sinensis]|uniref:Testicular haploid expressed gene protein-like isoform X4 n=1 Tax=Octopus sinensis TaxID=2607531 RepID=A0A7E6FLW8_9MOLL|nr:testicular haploid expressed gene protein-like isoform X4 [Octopus sinensis]